MKKTIIFIILLAVSNLALAANWYVRQGASGTATGADWTNAFTSLPTTLIRGDIYFIAGGSYPGRTFNTNASGTSVITIKGATVADHGTDTGWLNSYSVETTQATWTSGVVFNTSYWVFDGNYRVNLSKVATNYGFRMPSQHGPIRIFNDSVAITDISVRNCAAIAPAGDIEKWFLWTSNQTQSVNNVTITGILADGFSNTVHATSPAAQHTNWTFEHSASINGFSSALNHGEDINNNYGWHNNFVIRYNLFEGRPSGTGTIVVLNGPSGAYQIYGNIFKDQISGDGVIAGIHHNLSGNIYNNTFIRVNCTRWGDCAVNGNVSANVVNNIFYLQREHDGPGSGYNSGGIGISTTGTVSHNSFYDTPLPNIGSQPNAHVTTGNPFVNFAAGDYRLSAATQAGNTLTSPYNVDMLGATRGADGVFDRGAFEFVAGGGDTTPPTVSSTVPATSATGVSVSANVTATFSEALNPATVTTTTASIVRTSDSAAVTSAVSYAANIITINPNADLAASTQYTVTLTTGIQDVAGNALATTYSWTFTTAAPADTTLPTVSSTVPVTSATGVSVGANVTATFSEALNPATVTTTTASIVRTSDSAAVTSAVSYASNIITINPNADLAASTQYTVTLTTGIQDVAGNALATTYSWTFTTAGSGSFTKPPGIVNSYDFESACFLCDTDGSNPLVSSPSYNPTTLAGHIGTAAYFDGTKISTVLLTPANFTSSFSISGWFRRDSETTIRNTVYIEETRARIIGVLYGRVIFNVRQQQNTATRYKRFTGYNNAGLINATGWNHIVFTYAAGVARLYVNNVLVSTATWSKPQESIFNALQIGGTHTNNKFRGLIDQFYIFNTELSQASVTALFNQTVN